MEKNKQNLPDSHKVIFKESELEIFTGNLESRINQLVQWINARVHKKQWSNEEILEKFTKRSAQQILTEGDTGFMNSCSDLSLVAWALLKKNGLDPTLVVEKLKQTNYTTEGGFISLHFALEFSDKGILYCLEFVWQNQVLLSKGKYTHQKTGIETLKIGRIRDDIGFNQNIQQALEDKFETSDVQLESIIAQMQKDNTPQTYTNYVARLTHEGNLYLDLNI